jgi:microcystin-dependent protein
MSEPFLGEIKIVSFNFPPRGWAQCNGQLLPINQNQTLYALLGTAYGGNGQTTFALPNLRGRTPIHMSNDHARGEAAGSTNVTITQQTMAPHMHALQASGNAGNTQDISDNVLGVVPGRIYTDPGSLTTLVSSMVSSVGGSQPHNNMMPYLALNFIIALQGIFPTPN